MKKSIQIRIKNDLEYLFKEHILLSENVDESIKTIIEKLKQGYKDFDFKLERKESSNNETNFEFVVIDPNNEKFKIGVILSNSMINS